MKKILIIISLMLATISIVSCNKNQGYSYHMTLFSEELAMSYGFDEDGNRKMGYFDKDGNIVIEFKYKDACNFVNNKAIVSLDEEKYFFINKKDEKISSDYDKLEYDYNYEVYYAKNNEKHCLLDKEGKVISDEYDYIAEFRNGYSVVNLNQKYGYIDPKGKLVKPLIYDEANPYYTDGIAQVYENNTYKLIDSNFNVIFTTKFKENIWASNKNFVRLEKDGNIKIVDFNYNLIVDDISPSSNTLFGNNYVVVEGKVYSNTGKELLTGVKSAKYLGNCVFLQLEKNEAVIYDENFNKIKEFKCDEEIYLSEIEEDYYRYNVYFEIRLDDSKEWYLLENNKVKRQKFLEKYGSVEEIYMNYICVESEDGYGLIKLNGNEVYKANNDYRINATDDGYFVFHSDKGSVVAKTNKRKLIESKELYSICFTFYQKYN